MQYRTDPKSGNQLSALGFGCMRFPKSAALCEELITTAVHAGVNYFDTAYIYPGSEPTLGSILKKHGLREKIFLADKLPHFLCKKEIVVAQPCTSLKNKHCAKNVMPCTTSNYIPLHENMHVFFNPMPSQNPRPPTQNNDPPSPSPNVQSKDSPVVNHAHA